MRTNPFYIAIGIVCAVLLTSCTALERIGEPDVAALQQRLAEDPGNTDVMRDLGVAYFRTRQYPQAERTLTSTLDQTSADPHPQTLFYLGLTLDAQEKDSAALEVYGHYTNVPRSSKYYTLMEGRFRSLTRIQLAEQMRRTIEQEEELGTVDPTAIAVIPFRYLGEQERYAHIGRGLGSFLSIDLAKIQSLTVLERIRVQVLLDELALAQTPFVDASTAPRAGRLLGAGRIVQGVYNVPDDDNLVTDTGLLDLPTDTLFNLANSDALANLFRLEKDMVFQIAASLDIEPTPVERAAIEQMPTQNVQAFLAYCLGLAEEDNRQYPAAARHFEAALRLDPNFEEAESKRDEVEALAAAELFNWSFPTWIANSVEFGLPALGQEHLITERLRSMAGHMGSTIIPGSNNRKPVASEVGVPELPPPPIPPSGNQ